MMVVPSGQPISVSSRIFPASSFNDVPDMLPAVFGQKIDAADGGDGGQCLAPEAHGADGGQVLGAAELGGGVAEKGRPGVLGGTCRSRCP